MVTHKKIQIECLTSQLVHTSFLCELAEIKYNRPFYNSTKDRANKKSICKVFNSKQLQNYITIEANKKVVNCLNVTLDLNKQSQQQATLRTPPK